MTIENHHITKRGALWEVDYEVVAGIFVDQDAGVAWVLTCNGHRIDLPRTEAERMQQAASPLYQRRELRGEHQ